MNWDGETGTVTIGDNGDKLTSFYDTLIRDVHNNDWGRKGDIKLDGLNGFYMLGNHRIWPLVDYVKIANSFTIEFELAVLDNSVLQNGHSHLYLYLGSEDTLKFENRSITINGKSYNYPEEITFEEFNTYKVRMEDGLIHMYVNDEYINSGNYLGKELSIEFHLYDGMDKDECYLRNFSLNIND